MVAHTETHRTGKAKGKLQHGIAGDARGFSWSREVALQQQDNGERPVFGAACTVAVAGCQDCMRRSLFRDDLTTACGDQLKPAHNNADGLSTGD